MTFKDIFEKIAWIVERIVFWFCTFLLLGITAIVCLEIFSRNIVGHSFIWVEEISMIMLGWLAYISAAYTVRKKGHVALEFLYKKFPMPARKALFCTIISRPGAMVTALIWPGKLEPKAIMPSPLAV